MEFYDVINARRTICDSKAVSDTVRCALRRYPAVQAEAEFACAKGFVGAERICFHLVLHREYVSGDYGGRIGSKTKNYACMYF